MKKTSFLGLVFVVFLTACSSMPGDGLSAFQVQSSPRAGSAVTQVTPTSYGTPTPNQVQTAQAIIAIDGATSTANAAASGTAYAITVTTEAKATEAFWVNVTFGVATERGNETKIAKTETAGTQQADWKTQQPQTVTALVATQAIERAELKSKVASTWIWRVGGSLALIGFLYLLILSGFDARRYLNEKGNAKNLQEKTSAMKPDSQGRYPIIPSASLAKNETLLNPNLMHRAQLDPAKADDLSTEQALANTAGHNKLEAVRTISNSPAVGNLLKRMMKEDEAAKKSVMPTSDVLITKPDQPLLTAVNEIIEADWKFVENWDGKGNLIPCGVKKNGPAFVNIDDNDHYALFGLTGEGKSRGWLRPFLAGLLVSGHRAIILGKTGDFWMFDSYPNVNLIPVRDVTEKTEARRYADYLYRMVREMNQRDAWLTARHQSTWKRAGRENTFIVLDEIGNALEQMAKAERDDCMRWIASLVKQGRKNGFHVITASQRAVGFKNIVEQMSRVVFRLSDEASSRIALGQAGAEELPQKKGKFFAKFDTIDLYGSFMPTDEQLIQFLHSRPVEQHEPLDWIDATIIEDVSAPVSAGVSVPVSGVSVETTEPTTDRTAQIREAYFSRINSRIEFSLRDLERDVFGANGGAFFKEVRRAIAEIENVTEAEVSTALKEKFTQWKADSATATATGPKLADFEANPA